MAEHHSYYVDQEHLNFVDDLFDLFDLSPDEEEALLVLLKEEQILYKERINGIAEELVDHFTHLEQDQNWYVLHN